MANPYQVGVNTPGSGVSQVITVSAGTSTGDAIVVALGNTSAAGATVSGITDSKSNTYTRIGTANTSQEFGDWWISPSATPLTTSDTITVTWSATSGIKNCLAIGVPGLVAVSPVDQNPAWVHQGSGTSPTVASGTLSQASEMCLGIINNANLGLTPVLGNGFTQAGQLHTGTNAWTTVGYLAVSSTAAVTFSATIGSSAASLDLVTLKLITAAPPGAGQVISTLSGRQSAARGRVTSTRGPAPAAAPGSPPVLSRGRPAAVRGKTLMIKAPPPPPGPSVPSPFFPLRQPLRGRPAPPRGKITIITAPPVFTPPPPPVPSPFFPRRSPLRGAPAAARGTVAVITAPPPGPAPPPVTVPGGIPLPGDDKRLIRRRELRIIGMRL